MNSTPLFSNKKNAEKFKSCLVTPILILLILPTRALSTRGRMGMKLAFAWNVLGLLALANVVTRAILTTPGPLNLIHAEVPNLMFGTFPFTFIPGFFVPLAVVLHVLGIRSISRQRANSRPQYSSLASVDSKSIE